MAELSDILVFLFLHRSNVTSVIRTNSLIGTDFVIIRTPLFGLARGCIVVRFA